MRAGSLVARTGLSVALAVWVVLGGCAPPGSMPSRDSREAYVQASPDLSPAIRTAVLAGRVVIGMSARDVRATWGPPSGLHVDPGRTSGFDEQWVYTLWEHRTPIGQRNWSIAFRDGVAVCIHTWMG